MLLVSATGDWTKKMLGEEFPAIRNIYRLFGAEQRVAAIQVDAPHNYNRESREAVYGFFAHWMQGKEEMDPIKERAGVAPLTDLLVFYGRARPAGELTEEQLSASLIEMAKKQLDMAEPSDVASLEKYREIFGAALKFSLMAEYPDPANVLSSNPETTNPDKVLKEELTISRKEWDDRVPITVYKASSSRAPKSVIISVSADNSSSSSNEELAQQIAKAGHTFISVQCFSGGRKIPSEIKFFTTYNRTDDANRVQDILTAIAYAKRRFGNAKIRLVGHGEAGLWALLARALAPKIDRCAIDAAEFDTESDAEFIKRLAIPGLRRAGDITTAVAIAPLTALSIFNRGSKFHTEKIEALYHKFGRAED